MPSSVPTRGEAERSLIIPLRVPAGADTELNMTPMIDVVFQLLIFFLLGLKFKTIDRRIETMLPDHSH